MLEEIFTQIIEKLGNQYTVIKSFDAEQQIDLNGVLAVNVNDYQNLKHGTTKDCRYSISINGQTLTEQDKQRTIINTMFDYVLNTISVEDIKDSIANCVGVVINNGTITSDGQTNNFSVVIDLFMCID